MGQGTSPFGFQGDLWPTIYPTPKLFKPGLMPSQLAHVWPKARGCGEYRVIWARLTGWVGYHIPSHAETANEFNRRMRKACGIYPPLDKAAALANPFVW